MRAAAVWPGRTITRAWAAAGRGHQPQTARTAGLRRGVRGRVRGDRAGCVLAPSMLPSVPGSPEPLGLTCDRRTPRSTSRSGARRSVWCRRLRHVASLPRAMTEGMHQKRSETRRIGLWRAEGLGAPRPRLPSCPSPAAPACAARTPTGSRHEATVRRDQLTDKLEALSLHGDPRSPSVASSYGLGAFG
jgi:hypothetical protein